MSDLNISDISVSRNHSYVGYEEDGFYIYDAKSKFGTLIELRQVISVREESRIQLQHNGCVLRFEEMEVKME